jgi:hypothetical protein
MALLQNKQSGSVTIAVDNFSNTATVTAFVLARSLLKISVTSSESSPNDGYVTAVKTNTTTLTFTRTDDQGAATVAWELFEFDSDVTVQDVSKSGAGTAAISAVTLAQTFPVCTQTGINANYQSSETSIIQFNSTTEIEAVTNGGSPGVHEVQVVDYTGCAVQNTTHSVSTFTSLSTTDTITEVDTGATLVWGTSTTNAGAFTTFEDGLFQLRLTNATTLTMTRADTTSFDFGFNLFAVEFTDGGEVQEGELSVASTATSADATLVDLGDTGRIGTFLGTCHAHGFTYGKSTANSDDIPESAVRTTLPNTTTFRITRHEGVDRTATVTYQAMEWHVSVPPSGKSVAAVGSMAARILMGQI